MSSWKLATNSKALQRLLIPHLEPEQLCLLIDHQSYDLHKVVAVFIDFGADFVPDLSSLSFDGLLFSTKPSKYTDGVFAPDFNQQQMMQILLLVKKFADQKERLEKQQQLNREMTQIGIALSSEKELPKLLDMILKESRELAECEAASLYLVDKSDKCHPCLKFMLFQNERLDVPFEEKRYPLDHSSMAGHVALTGTSLNIPDVYQIGDDEPYTFDDGFDRLYEYRTREVLTIPMKNHNDEIIGILQLLNRKNPNFQGKAFESQTCDLISALASQSAVAIDNSLLLENIRELFEGFVSAAVTAIEARDPITSGHSFRVADYSCLLAEKLALHPSLKSYCLSVSEMRELRYAALLHDFGKVGVREHILQKAKKLSPFELELIRSRIKWYRQKLRADFYQSAFESRREAKNEFSVWYEENIEKHRQQMRQLDEYLSIIEEANEPSILHQDHFEKLIQLKDLKFESEGSFLELITEQEFLSLSVTRGSLTPHERDEIQSHVNHTYEFLRRIPWTQDLSNIPAIASAHHEKLDGSGYPFGLSAGEIPIQTRMMTIADIFDALTAADRPYKAALPDDRALDILLGEAEQGKLDRNLVDLFIDSKVFQLKQ